MNKYNLIPLSLFCILVIVFTPGVMYQEANAASISLGKLVTGGVYTNTPDLITVDLSSQCLALLKQNQTGDCTTYQKIFKYDNSNQIISGKFVLTNGFFHRLPTRTINHWGMYPPGSWVVMIDPDYNAIIHSKEITIVPTLNYINKDESVGSNHTINEYQQRYTMPNCSGAEIVYSDFLLNDTIHYLESGCTKTNFTEKVVKSTPHSTPIAYSPYSSIVLQNQLKKIFNGKSQLHNENIPIPGGLGIGNCINHGCNFTTSTKKPGY